MEFKDVFEKLKVNPELMASLNEALKRKADTKELYEMLVEAGLDAKEAEAAVAEYQRRCGLAIADDDVDEDMLRKVAGGGYGTSCTFEDDCDSSFKDSSNWGFERCDYNEYCDEVLGILY